MLLNPMYNKCQIRFAQFKLLLGKPLHFSSMSSYPGLAIPESIGSILVVRLDHIGDMVMSEPALRLIKEHFTNAKITLICAKWSLPVVEMMNCIDNVLLLNAPWHRHGDSLQVLQQFLKANKHRKFDIGIAFRQWLGDLWLLHKMDCSYRLGYKMIGIDRYIDKNVYLPEQVNHSTQLTLNLISNLGVDFQPDTIPMLSPTSQGEKQAEAFLINNHIERESFVALHIKSRENPRCWNEEAALTLSSIVWNRFALKTVLLGSPDEIAVHEKLMQDKPYILSSAGQLDITGVFSLLLRAKAFVGVDSGPAHLAAASGIPTLVLWSCQVPKEKTCPRGSKTTIVVNECEKYPCYLEECPLPGHPCMSGHQAEVIAGRLGTMI